MKINGNKNIPELLAPAGTFQHLRGAVNAGADAVYVGGKKWGARSNAGNFDDDEMIRAAEYCHLRDAKLYVTMNTLIFDDEIEEALEYVRFLYNAGVDALIIQDFGLASLVKKYFPDFHVHLSTQASVYSKEGVRAAMACGFERVVLAREVSISDIKKIHEECDIELEVFVHGALCYCYSGQCQLSRFRGGRSGNRGMCAQPCRLPYSISGRSGLVKGGKDNFNMDCDSSYGDDFGETEEAVNAGTAVYLLSPKDLCGIDSLGDLLDAGVASLKIEGRMKSPEYVAVVVSVYRKYLDMLAQEGFCIVSEEDRRALSQIFNRGGFTNGYYYGNPGEKLMSGKLPKHQGVKIGHVVKRGKGDLVQVEIDRNEVLNMGDGIEIRNSEMPGNVVTYIKDAVKERQLIIGDIRGRVNPGDEVYKITDKALMEKASLYFALDKEGNERTVKKLPVRMSFTAKLGEPASLRVFRDAEGALKGDYPNSVTVLSETAVEAALNKPLTKERAAEQLGKTGGSVFTASYIEADIDDNVSLPMSQINKMRRDALELLAEEKAKAVKNKRSACRGNNKSESRDRFVPLGTACSYGKKEQPKYVYVHRWDDTAKREVKRAIEALTKEAERDGVATHILVPVKAYMEHRHEMNEDFMPYTSNISKGEEDCYIRENFDEIKAACGKSGIVCGNIGWAYEFLQAGIKVTAGFGLNAANSYTKEFLENMGCCHVIPSLELADKDGLGDMGALPLMITEHILPEIPFESKNGERYMALTNQYGDKNILYKSGKYSRLFII